MVEERGEVRRRDGYGRETGRVQNSSASAGGCNHRSLPATTTPPPRVCYVPHLISLFSSLTICCTVLTTFVMAKHKNAPKPNQNLPAHETKHLMHLDYTFKNSTFTLAQSNDGATNGTALWLGAQILTAWLSEHYGKKHRTKRLADRRPKMIELGSGIGLTAYVILVLR